MTGGVAALVGAIFLGPRTGRFSPSGECIDMPGHSSVLVALGTFILWFGWYGFNPVSTLAFEYMETAARVAVTTTLGAAAGGVTALSIHHGRQVFGRRADVTGSSSDSFLSPVTASWVNPGPLRSWEHRCSHHATARFSEA